MKIKPQKTGLKICPQEGSAPLASPSGRPPATKTGAPKRRAYVAPFDPSLLKKSARRRDRTSDPLIKSQLLYQLSYAGIRTTGQVSGCADRFRTKA